METKQKELLFAKDVVLSRGNRKVFISQFSLLPGDRLAILGANGTGKSTLCLAIAGLIRFAAGELRHAPDFKDLVIGYLPQSGGLYPHLTVAENISFFQRMYGRSGIFDPRMLPVLWTLGLDGVLAVRAQALSGGYFRLASLACVLSLNVDALILDEPAAGLDEQRRIAVGNAIRSVADELKFLVVTGHKGEDAFSCNRTFIVGQPSS